MTFDIGFRGYGNSEQPRQSKAEGTPYTNTSTQKTVQWLSAVFEANGDNLTACDAPEADDQSLTSGYEYIDESVQSDEMDRRRVAFSPWEDEETQPLTAPYSNSTAPRTATEHHTYSSMPHTQTQHHTYSEIDHSVPQHSTMWGAQQVPGQRQEDMVLVGRVNPLFWSPSGSSNPFLTPDHEVHMHCSGRAPQCSSEPLPVHSANTVHGTSGRSVHSLFGASGREGGALFGARGRSEHAGFGAGERDEQGAYRPGEPRLPLPKYAEAISHDSFMSQFNGLMDVYRSSGQRKVMYLEQCVKGSEAESWLRRFLFENGRGVSWEALEKEFKAAFTSFFDGEEAQNRLEDRVMRPDETVRKYVMDKLDLCVRFDPYMRERDRIHYVTAGLPEAVHEYLMGHAVTTVNHLLDKLILVEAQLKGRSRYRSRKIDIPAAPQASTVQMLQSLEKKKLWMG
ncbi:hypothetical protein ONE63_010350 [Megalurothrips usitatus]|uniref:Retrotransposon gag domain-containing protein n=1 Tax=Megalurothrips usitatus TaxID=439358 RepID=A0AAV7XKC8_9NEOP|nr:hypothetical protein ONE63_010350 [Megalurothrips usitatus]